MGKTRDMANLVSKTTGLKVFSSNLDASINIQPSFKELTSKYIVGLDSSLNTLNDVNIRQDASINALYQNSPVTPAASDSLMIAYSIALS